MGATGSGKTTLINGMINFILGFEWDDDFRFKIIVESGAMSQAFSQTSAVTAYEIHYTDGFKIPFSLTIVDSPGYGDTKGLSHAIKSTFAAGRNQLTQLIHQVEYFFRVAAVTPPGRSPFSPLLGPEWDLSVCNPHSKICYVYVTDSIMKLRWDEPANLDKDLKVTRYKLQFWPQTKPEASALRFTTQERGYKLEKIQRGTTYNIRGIEHFFYNSI